MKHRAPTHGRSRIAKVAAVGVAFALAILGVVPASASTVTSATFTGGAGTVTVSGTVYAKTGGALTLAVMTSSDTKCVEVTGLTRQTSSTAKASWTFATTAPTGNGTQPFTVAASPNFNGNGCTGQSQSPQTASYVLDNTGPVITPVLDPTPNAAGWNNQKTTVTWTAADPNADTSTAGSGVATQPTASASYNQNGIIALTAPTGVADRLGNIGSGSGTLRLDKSAPSIIGSRTPAANGFGWNSTPVTVSFTCSENPATDSSGIAAPGCPASTVLGSSTDPTKDVTNGSDTGSVTDIAGNGPTTDTVTGINVDTVKPTLTGAATAAANGNGWYKSDVTVHWTAADVRSGLDPATVPGDSVVSGEGSALTVSASVSDKAGNTVSANSPSVSIDRTAPVTGISGQSNAWTNGNVTVTLSPSDALSHVASTTYSIDGGAAQAGTSFTLSSEGDHTITYASTDNAGNVEATKTAHVKIDKTAPTISHAFTPPAYLDGAWTNAAKITVTFTCTDGGSGVANCTPASDVTAQGGGQQVNGIATDNAGNTASNTATVSIDRIAPTVSAAAERAANGNGWYDSNVKVSYTCADQATLSGIQTCPATETIGEGKNQTASGSATDNAGNSTTASLTGLNVDKIAPTLSGSATTSPNGNGWYDNSVTVAWTCSDALSDIDGLCPANSTVSGEGSNLGASASVSDKAGHTTTAAVTGLKIDTTVPVTTSSVSAPLSTGWYADKARVTLNSGDNLSGIDATYYTVDGGEAKTYDGAFDFSTPGVHTITFWSRDNAGNVEDSTGPGHTVTVKIDGIKPTISGSASPAPNAAGWNNSDVAVEFACSDAESGIASCVGGTAITTDVANQSVTGTATDNGGNSDTATVGPINLDETPPSLSGSATTSPNTHGWYNSNVTVHWTANDATSGVDEGALPDNTTVSGEGSDLTAGPVSVMDVAGNTGSGSLQHLKIDRTKPVITGTPTTSGNGAGWYGDDVAVHWACSDTGSGIETGGCPDNTIIKGEGDSLSATASVADQADNTSTGTVSGIQIDRTAPSTEISAPSAWRNSDATVTFSPHDSLSGVKDVFYTVNGGDVQSSTTATFTEEGVYALDVWSVDNAGNVETHKSAEVKIDKSAPTISHTQDPIANDNGWNKTNVTITFACNDTGGSGIKSCTEPITETHEGTGQPEAGTATDNAGNSSTDPATVSIDKSKPTISGAPNRDANANGWYKANVTVTFICGDQDGLSGIKNCADDVTLNEGADQLATGTATDAAENSDSVTVTGISVDRTAPTLSGATTTPSNGAGWNTGDVTVAWTCADQAALSGIDSVGGSCPADSTVTGEGDSLVASTEVSDKAGNSTLAKVEGIHIDRTAPTTTSTLPTPDSSNGWYRAGPTISLIATDTLSGVSGTFYAMDGGTPQPYAGAFTEALEGVHTVTFWSTDNAGNVENAKGAGNTVTVRVDTTKPTISGSRQPAANGAGWNNGPVTVGFTCDDTEGSGIDTCTDPVTVSTQGANQSIKGDATDKVGNARSTTVDGINIDLTNPSLSGAATTFPNLDGWYNSNVSVAWTCSDALSGIDGPCPANSTLSGEGDNLSASTSVTDKAGNATPATVSGIQIDRHGPVTAVSAPSDWQTSGVVLDVEATDPLSGVRATHYTVNGGLSQTGNQIALAADGTYTLTFWSVDKAGNEGVHGTASVKIDKAAPSINHTIKPEPNAALWNNSDATVHFLCDDPTSGVKSCTADSVITLEKAEQKVTGTAVDNAGNSSIDTATVNLDKTKPIINGTPDRAANANSWYDDNVTVNFACGDNLSGPVGCAGAVILAEGSNQSAAGSVSDVAGNNQSTTISGINVDKTAPVLTGTVTTANSGGDFYNGNVTVQWTCSDALSGISGACPADATVTGEGTNLSATASVTDKAGNATTTTVSGIKIDRTAPVTTASAPDPTYSSGWYGAPVTVTLDANDNLSGVSTTKYAIDGGSAVVYDEPFSVGKGVHTVTYWSTDEAGNTEDRAAAGHSLTLKIDDLAPRISGAAATDPNANGWYRGSVTVHFTCSDAETEVRSCPANQHLSDQGADQYVSGTASDVAGNTATAKVGPISIDLTKPTFAAYTGATSFTVGQSVTAPTCAGRASDSLSGLDSCALTGTSGSGFTNANGVGDFTYTFTASDKAGNTATQTVTQHVGYKWTGFLQPVTNTAHDLTVASTFKAGSTIPMKFQLKDSAGAVKQGTYMPVWLQPVDLGATTAGSGIAGTDAGTVGGSYKWDASAQQYIFTWQTPKTGVGHYYRVGVQLDSGDVYTTLIKLS
jgi:hypothetical protein